MRSVAVQRRARPIIDSSPGAITAAFNRLFTLDQEDTCELILARHAEPDYAAASTGKQPWDPPLTEKGRFQAHRLALRLRRMEIDAVFTSTMRRAIETAAFVSAAKDLPMVRVHQLREVDFDPSAVRKAGADIRQMQAELAIRFVNKPRWDSLPGFEPSHEFRTRVVQAVRGIVAHHPGQRVAVVTHGGVINAYLSMLLEIPKDMFFMPEHASMTVVRALGDLSSVQRINDFAHLLPTFNLR